MFSQLQVESSAFTHFECGDAAWFPVRNWKILHTQMKGWCWCAVTVNFRGDRFSSVLENQVQIWSTNFGVLPVISHWLLPSKDNIPWTIRLHRTSEVAHYVLNLILHCSCKDCTKLTNTDTNRQSFCRSCVVIRFIEVTQFIQFMEVIQFVEVTWFMKENSSWM